jgi:hypothetical protein
MTTLYENQLYERAQREFAQRQSMAPTKTVWGVTFQQVVHGDSRHPEQWRVKDAAPTGSHPLPVIESLAHKHQGASFTGWRVGANGPVHATLHAAMEAAVPMVRERVAAHLELLRRQASEAETALARIDRGLA